MPADQIRAAVAMPWGGERNLALRAALGLADGEVGMVNRGDVVQVVVDAHGRANRIARRLKGSLAGWRVTVRHTGRYVVTCYTDDGALEQAARSQRDLLGRLTRG